MTFQPGQFKFDLRQSIKLVVYALLLVNFAWDEALWIIGFCAIEMNIDDWKKEIEEAETAAVRAT